MRNRTTMKLVPLMVFLVVGTSGCEGGSDGDDGGSGDGGGDAGCTEAPWGSMHERHVLRFEGDGTVVTIRRLNEGIGTGESWLYALERMVVEREGACVDIEGAASLTYENSHHNWRDRAIGVNDGVRYELFMEFAMVGPSGWAVSLTATAVDDGSTRFEIADMLATGGPILGYSCPSHVPVFISEFMPDNRTTLADEHDDFDPWIELFNPSSQDVDLEGYGLTDDPSMPHKWTFPAGTVIPRHECLIVWADGETQEGGLHAGFALDPTGGQVRLSRPEGISTGERAYDALGADQSYDLDWASAGYVVSDSPSPGVKDTP